MTDYVVNRGYSAGDEIIEAGEVLEHGELSAMLGGDHHVKAWERKGWIESLGGDEPTEKPKAKGGKAAPSGSGTPPLNTR